MFVDLKKYVLKEFVINIKKYEINKICITYNLLFCWIRFCIGVCFKYFYFTNKSIYPKMVEKPYFCKVISIWIAFLRLASLIQFFAVFFFIYYLKQKIIKILNQVFLINTIWRSLRRAFVIRNKSFQVMLNKIFWIHCKS